MRTRFLFVLLVLPLSLIRAQSDIAIGEWASYLPYNIGLYVTQSEEKIIYGTSSSIFTIDKEDFSVEFLSRVDGLTETGIAALEYDPYNEQVIVAYQNSIIDFINGSEVFPVFEINETGLIQGDKNIYDIFVQNERWVYFATGFGVVQYDMQRREFGFTLDASRRVQAIDGNEDYIIISADDGAYLLDMAIQTPNFFGSWKKLDDGLPALYEPRGIMIENDRAYVATEERVFVANDYTTFSEIFLNPYPDYEMIFLTEAPEGWMLGLRDAGTRSRLIIFDDADVPVQEVADCTNRLRDAVIDETGRIFFADDWEGIRYMSDPGGTCPPVLNFNGPKSEEASDIDIENGRVFVASGGVSDNFANLFGRHGFYILNEGQWINIHENNSGFIRDNDIIQSYKIAAHPDSSKVYVGSFWAGLVEYNYETGAFRLFDKSNSPLAEPVGDPLRVKISGLVFDRDDNLWISNFGAVQPLVVYTSEGNWHTFPVPSDTRLTELVVDDQGFVWAVVGGLSGGVVVYDPGPGIADPTDNPHPVFLNNTNSDIPSNIVNSIAVDLDGAVWVGTSAGVVVFDCGGGIFDGSCDGNKPLVLQDSIAAFLLETEDVLSIAVDGANRKWFGTRNGIFVQSPSGEEQVAHFTVENSLLFDNTIKAMAYDPESGEMVIATNKGLQAYRTLTTGARDTHSGTVYAFPNPVRPGYTGVIAIKGLARDAEVRITDIDGQLVYKTTALGGQAIWDGHDLKGREVAGGVYLVFSSSSDSFRDPDSYVTKILVVR